MADDKNGREDQAQNAEERQRERELSAALERRDEAEPPVDPAAVGGLERELAAVPFPATGAEVVATVGDLAVESDQGIHTIAELIPEPERFDAPAAVAARVEHPTIAGAMKRVVEACQSVQGVSLEGSQRDAYERTFRELAAIDTVDENEPIRSVADWALEYLERKGELPGSRGVRRQAAKVCRSAGYSVRNDEWLGV